MNKRQLTLALFTILAVPSIGQTNLDFEYWTTTQSIENPDNWTTNNQNNFICVSKSSDAVSGLYSAEVHSNGASIEGRAPGVLTTTISALSSPLSRIEFQIKIDSIDSDGGVIINTVGYKNNQIIYNDSISFNTTSNSWSLGSLTISDTTTVPDSISITCTANSTLYSTGFQGYTKFHIDEISLKHALNLAESQSNTSRLFITPNPASSQFEIHFNSIDITQIKLVDYTGKVIKNIPIDQRVVETESIIPGVYYLVVISNDVYLTSKLLII